MKLSKGLKSQTRRLLIKNLIVIITLAIAGSMGVMSWLRNAHKVDAGGMKLSCVVPEGLEIAIVDPTEENPEIVYKTAGEDFVLSPENYPFLDKLSFSEVTGAVNSTGAEVYEPKLLQSGGVVTVDTTGEPTVSVPNTKYLSFDLYMRCKEKKRVLLSSDSKICPADTGWSSKIGNLNFSKDAIDGAVRFCISNRALSSGNQSNAPLLWIPAPNIYYDADTQVVRSDISNGDFATDIHTYYAPYNGGAKMLTTPSGYVVSNFDGTYNLGVDMPFADLVKNGDYYVNHVNIKLWIEGEDPEARRAFVGGSFAMSLVLELGSY